MKTYKLSKEYNYVIYGAAFLGVQILTGLRNSGYNVNAFLDKRASELKEVEGVKVYEPQSYKSDNKENVVVIVAVTTTFEHPKIATYLRTLGYHKIICKMDENAGLVADNLKKIAYAYDKILECCKDQAKDKLFLLALGPTATVLAYDLCKIGYQAVDIGHIDLEYEWFLKGQGCRTEIVGKYNNELAGGDKPVEIQDKQYQSQIIADFS